MLPDNKHFCTCSTDATVRIWNFDKEIEAETYLVGFRDFVSGCIWVDNNKCIGASWDSIINFYNIDWNYVKDFYDKGMDKNYEKM